MANEFLASREKSAFQLIRENTYKIPFSLLAVVSKVYKSGEDPVLCIDCKDINSTMSGKETEYKGIEVVRFGNGKANIYIEPEVGDIVMLFAFQNFSLKQELNQKPAKPQGFVPYSVSTMKAVLIQPTDPKDALTNIQIKGDGVIELWNDADKKNAINIDLTNGLIEAKNDSNTLTVDLANSEIKTAMDCTIDLNGAKIESASGKLTLNGHLEIAS